MEISEKANLKNFRKLKIKTKRAKISKKIETQKGNILIKIFRYLIIIIGLFIIFFLLYWLILKLIRKENMDISQIFKKAIHITNNGNNNNILESYIKAQKDFCDNPNKYLIQKYEDGLLLQDVKINDLNYQIYIYKSNNGFKNSIKRRGAWENDESNNVLEALKFYATEKNLSQKDVIMLDIGGCFGWYPSFLGRYNYTILSFEAFEKNSYASKKNYCLLNKDSNVIVITKGLGAKEETCSYFSHNGNEGNGMVICDKERIKNRTMVNIWAPEGEVQITTLNNFMPYLADKNIGLIKMDVEGHEVNVLKGGGNELITKYHVPFVVLEFAQDTFREVGSDYTELAHLFVDNGYKITRKGFFSKEYITYDDLITKVHGDVYFIHQSILEKIP